MASQLKEFPSPSIISLQPLLTRQPQGSSPLMQLPAEIRLMILHNLLVSNNILGERQSYIKPKPLVLPQKPVQRPTRKTTTRASLPRKAKKTQPANVLSSAQQAEDLEQTKVQGYGIYTAVLQTCQQVLCEGWPLLYGENVLHIYVTTSWNDAILFYRSSEQSPHMMISALGNDSFVDLSGRKFPIIVDQSIISFASHFQTFEFQLDFQTKDHNPFVYRCVRSMIKALRPCLTHKRVQVALEDTHHLQSEQQTTHFAKLFELLRCRSMTMSGVDEAVSSSVCDTVTGSSPVVDLDGACRKLEIIRSDFCRSQTIFPVEQQMEIAHDAVRDFNVEKFEKSRAVILEILDEDFAVQKREVIEASFHPTESF